MTRGRKPKPTHLKLIEGNPGKRPIRIGPERPVTTMPGPPDHLNADARTEWDRVAHGLHALRLLETVDRAALAAYCTAYARWVLAERAIAEMGKRDMLTGGLMIKTSNGNAIQNPLVGTANKAASDMVRYAAEFGMTPSARVNTTARVPIRKVEALLPATGTSVRPGIRARSARAWSEVVPENWTGG